ncbi:MAG: carbohydrate porin [Prosthecobacter sp.]|uniref:carbohydrate porin n=1 Tax=Prosthecobacter sp. TaxID=1965333 RepID=UPI0039039A16
MISRFLLLLNLALTPTLFSQQPQGATVPKSGEHWLARHGVVFSGCYIAEALGNVHGGRRTGAVYDGLLTLCVDVELEKLSGWHGATMHASLVNPHGSSLTNNYVGDRGVVSNIDAYDSLRLYEAWIEQAAFGGRVTLRAGFLAADAEFCVTDMAAPFINGSFGAPTGLSGNFAYSNYPYSALGLSLHIDLTPEWCVLLGAYDGNVAPGVFPDPTPGAALSNELNHYGTHFALRHAEGAMFFAEVGWRHGDAGEIKVGGTFHTDAFADIGDVTLAANGSPLAPAVARSNEGNYALYAIAEHDLWRAAGTGGAGLGAFIRGVFTPPDRNFFSHTAEAGLVYRGLLQSEARDKLGLGVIWLGISPEVRNASRTADVATPRDEVVLELTYQYAVTPCWSIQPDAQWIFNTGGTGADALVIGLRSTLSF